MSEAASTPDSAPTAADAVFDRILTDIVRGEYPPQSRLPAERELARTLGASRPTLREALRRLAEWNLVESRRGSGVVVRPELEWSMEVLPAYLRYGAATRNPRVLAGMVRDLLDVRRMMFANVTRIVAPRLPRGALHDARDAVQRAWYARHDIPTFVREDYGVMRALLAGGNFLPAVWMLNRLASVYFDLTDTLSPSMGPPPDYVTAHGKFFDALGAGDIDRAVELIDDYLASHDRHIIAALEALA